MSKPLKPKAPPRRFRPVRQSNSQAHPLSDNGCIRWSLVLVGLLALLLGVSVYVLDRPALETYFVPQAASLYTPNTSWFGVIGNYLPDFLHAFAFCLITIGVLGGGRQVALFCGLFWLLIESLFELGQHNLVAHAIAPYIPGWFDQLPVLENTRAYFTAGHFDPLDLLAIALGVLAAYGLARTSRPQH